MLDMTIKTFSEINSALYLGPYESPRWDSFLQLLKKICKAESVNMGLRRPLREDDAGVVFWKSDRSYDEMMACGYYAELDDFTNLPRGEVVTLHDIYTHEQLARSAYYQNWLKPNNFNYLLGTDIYKDDQVAIYIRLTRGAGCENFGDFEKSLLKQLQPHFQNLVLWLDNQEALNSELSIYEGVTRHLALGTILVEDDGSIIKTNPISDYLLNSEDGLYVEQGRLACKSTKLNQTLTKMLAGASSPDGKGKSGSLSIPRNQSTKPLLLTFKPRATSEFTGAVIRANNMVFIYAPEMQITGSPLALQEMLGLTKAETRLVIELANGLTVRQIIDKIGVTENTVRTHLKKIFRKTEVSNQSSLVSMALRCIASLG